MEHDLSGRVAVVVGGGQSPGPGLGNGRATCLGLSRHGATVVAVARHLDRAQTTIDMIAKEGGKGWAYAMDVVDRDQCAKLFQDVKDKYGRIDIMVYNVGITLEFDFETNTATLDAVNRLFDVDLVGCVWCTLECAPIMAEQETGGAIVNVSSIASRQNGTGVHVGYGFYALSKAAMNKWGELSARYYAPMGVRINTLVLGQVASIMGTEGVQYLQGGIDQDEAVARHDASVLLKGGRKTVWETANAITFLVSDEAKFVAGLEFVLDGGSTIARGPDPELLQLKMKMAKQAQA
ncbi:MAG: SDR family oxidoreductase [Bifidobacteriaceae bacterium]|jgi:NAD(P)-dependent dehydrogenase (short-subunit alcohol dehydrogenase family)|nr:SDR family oxidoreductase [Bifidobacteriaceae bacterium]